MAWSVGVSERQQVLDAAAALQELRRRAVSAIGVRPAVRDSSVEVTCTDDLSGWLMRTSWQWGHVLSTRDVTTGSGLARSMPNNRRRLSTGLRMTSVFDYAGTDDAARAMLECENDASYLYGFAPLQMRIVDGTSVLMHGPSNADDDTVLRMQSATVVEAALRYWRAVLVTVRPCTPESAANGFTLRQQQILTMLQSDLSDDRIAESLRLSVRTVRYEVAAVLRLLGVRSRFAAGYAYAHRTGGSRTTDHAQ